MTEAKSIQNAEAHPIEVHPQDFYDFKKCRQRAVITDSATGEGVVVAPLSGKVFDNIYKSIFSVFMVALTVWAIPMTKQVNSNSARLTLVPHFTPEQGVAMDKRLLAAEHTLAALASKQGRDEQQEIRIAQLEALMGQLKIPPDWFRQMVERMEVRIEQNAALLRANRDMIKDLQREHTPYPRPGIIENTPP